MLKLNVFVDVSEATQIVRLIESEIDVRVPSNCAAVSVSASKVHSKLVACGRFDGTVLVRIEELFGLNDFQIIFVFYTTT